MSKAQGRLAVALADVMFKSLQRHLDKRRRARERLGVRICGCNVLRADWLDGEIDPCPMHMKAFEDCDVKVMSSVLLSPLKARS